MLESLFRQFAKILPPIRDEEIFAYQRHYEILKEWNEKINLVSRSSFDKSFESHYVDCLYISYFAEPFIEKRPVFDVGTGAGFPGIIFSIRYSKYKIALIEHSIKKQKYLSDAISGLGLKNVKLMNDLPSKPIDGFFFARAVYPPNKLFDFFSQHLRKGSRFVVNLGGQSTVEQIPKGFRKIFETTYTLPLDCGDRRLEIFERST